MLTEWDLLDRMAGHIRLVEQYAPGSRSRGAEDAHGEMTYDLILYDALKKVRTSQQQRATKAEPKGTKVTNG